ncbi:MAG: hypothetical protein ABI155_16455 [Paralcaligenes sp.]
MTSHAQGWLRGGVRTSGANSPLGYSQASRFEQRTPCLPEPSPARGVPESPDLP